MRQALAAKTYDPLFDLLAGELGEEPVQFCTVAVLQRPFNDERCSGLRIELREIVFLQEGSESGRDGKHQADSLST